MEFNITKEDGSGYVYGLPVFNSNEVNLNFGVEDQVRFACSEGENTNCIQDNYLVYKDIRYNNFPTPKYDDQETVIGDLMKEPYAGLYLLTQITTPDYIDRGIPGPDNDDFGGWTNFYYNKKHKLADPYRWRTPYNGLHYAKNRISDTNDDLASVMSGDKEVCYLKAIETKTHIAFFITNKTKKENFADCAPANFIDAKNAAYFEGSQTRRNDGWSAYEVSSGKDEASGSPKIRGRKELEYLERIVLFSKSRPQVPISTSRFDYDYSLVQNLPNNYNGQYPTNSNRSGSGKLTLKRVWFEYEGKVPTRISPYTFKYQYPKYSGNLPSEYASIFSELSNKYSAEAQNPNYQLNILDSWGQIQNDGQERRKNLIPWPSQGESSNGQRYDPAAWQLKNIVLPSGGEIIIDYEENDYSYVQDRPAMAMASLLSDQGKPNEFILDVKSIGIDPIREQNLVEELVRRLNQTYHSEKDPKKIYYKFLYDFKGNNPNIDNCSSEYITGYADFERAEAVTINGQKQVKVILSGDDSKLPKKACHDFFKAFMAGKNQVYKGFAYDCLSKAEEKYDQDIAYAIEHEGGVGVGKILELLGYLATDEGFLITSATGTAKGLAFDLFNEISKDYCNSINPSLSFLKVPMIKAKKGGGIRVKRLLMFDKGMGGEEATLYGNEYKYITENGSSSGVATNEPSSMREENPLVEFLPQKEQGWFSRLIAGENKESAEGPIGESILPSPAIGYSRVEVHNIHKGATSSGIQVYEYFTAKDYPFNKYYTQNDPKNFDVTQGYAVPFTDLEENTIEGFTLKIPGVVFNYNKEETWMAQGFRFIINNMHGQIKRVSNYGTHKNGERFLSSSQSYSYYEPGEKVWTLQPDGTFKKDIPGKEEDITMEMRSIYNESKDFSAELDISVGLMFPPPIFASVIPSYALSEQELSMHSTSKVISYSAILKKVETYQDGVSQTQEQLAFSQHSGRPVLTRTTDEYDGLNLNGKKWDGAVYKLEVPASLIAAYREMGPKYQNPAYSNQLLAMSGTFVTYGEKGNPLNNPRGIYGLQNVMNASIQTYARDRNWFPPKGDSEYGVVTGDLNKLTLNWLPKANYLFKSDIISTYEDPTKKLYETGVIKQFSDFNWVNEPVNLNNGWIKTNEITKYSPHGLPLEERDVLNLFHAIRYSPNYNFTVPAIRADNASYQDIYFQDFENPNTSDVVRNKAHTGSFSMQLDASATQFKPVLTDVLRNTSQLSTEGAWLKCWVHEVVPTDQGPRIEFSINSPVGIGSTMDKIAKVGEWILYSKKIPKEAFRTINQGSNITIHMKASSNIYVDDIRFQPYEAKASCYVYDFKTLKLLAQFDDQHFGLFYQYDDEGRLVRKLIETERGVRTVQENHINTPKVNKE